MTPKFSTLDNAKAGEKISFVGHVSNVGDMKSGTGAQGDYTYKRLTIQDATAALELTVWDEDIKKFMLGRKYEIINAFAKDYQGKITLGIKYAEVKMVDTDTEQSTVPELPPAPAPPRPKGVTTGTRPKSAPVEEPAEESKLPTVPEQFLNFIENETITLLQIEQDVKSVMAHYGANLMNVDGGKIGMFVKEIYRESKKIKFEKI